MTMARVRWRKEDNPTDGLEDRNDVRIPISPTKPTPGEATVSQLIASPFGTVILSEICHENVLERMFGESMPKRPPRNPRLPAVGVYEISVVFILLMDWPGVRKGDIEVKYSNDTLSICAEAKGLQRDDGHWILHERRIGRYVRGVNLVRAMDPSNISAGYTDGNLHLPIKKPASDVADAVDTVKG